MKKISLLLVMIMGLAFNALAQSTVPIPLDPESSNLDWLDYEPIVLPNGNVVFAAQLDFMIGCDLSERPVANDYDIMLDSLITGEVNYTVLDEDKVSYSIYTDFDELYVFTPEKYEEFTEPTTNVPFLLTGTAHFLKNREVHFEETNYVDGIEGLKPFFQWRIGIQVHYTVDGVTSSSNIVYIYPLDCGDEMPVTLLGDVNDDGFVTIADVTALIDYLLGGEVNPFNKFNADVNQTADITIADVTALIDKLLS